MHLTYLESMIRSLTSLLWLIAALALGFEAAAQPCDLKPELAGQHHHEMSSDMPCHDDMAALQNTPSETPEHDKSACCCAALLGNGVTTNAPSVSQPVPGLTLWAAPMPDSANSILLDYEPPPPRA